MIRSQNEKDSKTWGETGGIKKQRGTWRRLLHVVENCFRHRSVPPVGGITSQNQSFPSAGYSFLEQHQLGPLYHVRNWTIEPVLRATSLRIQRSWFKSWLGHLFAVCKSLNLSVPQFLHLYDEGNHSTHLWFIRIN